MEWALSIAGVIVGAVIGWSWATARARAQSSAALGELQNQLGTANGTLDETRAQIGKLERTLAELREALDGERTTRTALQERLDAAQADKKELKDTFTVLSAQALDKNSERFVKQAEERLKPLREALEKFQKQSVEMEATRHKAMGGVSEQLRAISLTHKELQEETHKLVAALRRPGSKGRWGEMQLRRAMEVAGMSAHCDFTEQVSVATDDGRLRPDVLVHLPDKRDMVVDSKVPLNAFLESIDADSEERRIACLKRHAAAVRDHVKKLSRKEYASQFAAAPDFVVMFLPGESVFNAALEQDGSLIEDSIQSGVVIATPSTLIALLRAVAYGWQQYEATQNARHIADEGRELFERVRVFTEHLTRIGDGLRKTTDAYNRAVSSYDSRVRPSGERMSELGSLPSDKTLPEVSPVDTMPTLLPDDRA